MGGGGGRGTMQSQMMPVHMMAVGHSCYTGRVAEPTWMAAWLYCSCTWGSDGRLGLALTSAPGIALVSPSLRSNETKATGPTACTVLLLNVCVKDHMRQASCMQLPCIRATSQIYTSAILEAHLGSNRPLVSRRAGGK